MPKIREPLRQRLEGMADDIQIGGEVCFRSMALAIVYVEMGGATLSKEQAADMERLLRRAAGLLRDLHGFWGDHPDLDKLVDRGAVAAR